MIRSGLALIDGWLVVPYNGRDLATVEIGFGAPEPSWHPAFLDFHGEQRVAKVRIGNIPPANRVAVWLRVNGVADRVGTVN